VKRLSFNRLYSTLQKSKLLSRSLKSAISEAYTAKVLDVSYTELWSLNPSENEPFYVKHQPIWDDSLYQLSMGSTEGKKILEKFDFNKLVWDEAHQAFKHPYIPGLEDAPWTNYICDGCGSDFDNCECCGECGQYECDCERCRDCGELVEEGVSYCDDCYESRRDPEPPEPEGD